MSRKRIEYPRKCPHCSNISTDPFTYSYHKRTHKAIPEGTLCDLGCDNEAKFVNTNNKYTCQDSFTKCPAYLKRLSYRTKKDWEGGDEIICQIEQQVSKLDDSFVQRYLNCRHNYDFF